jgi:hypothetical protein
VHLPNGTLDRAIDDRIARVLAAAAYFRLFWVVGVDGPNLRRVRDGLAWAGAERVGLIIIDDPAEVEDPKLRIELQAVFGLETPSTELLRRALASAQEKCRLLLTKLGLNPFRTGEPLALGATAGTAAVVSDPSFATVVALFDVASER